MSSDTGNGGQRLPRVAPRRFELRLPDWIAIGVILSVGAHYALFTFFPPVHAAEIGRAGEELTAVKLPPAVSVPPPPERVARPAVPRIAARPVAEDLTIAPTTFEANPVENLAPPPLPPAPPRTDDEEQPRFIPYDTPPRLLNREEVRKLLQRDYPSDLREARIEGSVVIWAFIDTDGRVVKAQVQQSSGYAAMDRAALDVARNMQFSPAKNRDKPTAVWVQQAIRFKVM
jgi:protein TonB